MRFLWAPGGTRGRLGGFAEVLTLCVLSTDRFKQSHTRLGQEQRVESPSVRQRHLEQSDALGEAAHRRKHLDQALLSQDEFQQVSPIKFIKLSQTQGSRQQRQLIVSGHRVRALTGQVSAETPFLLVSIVALIQICICRVVRCARVFLIQHCFLALENINNGLVVAICNILQFQPISRFKLISILLNSCLFRLIQNSSVIGLEKKNLRTEHSDHLRPQRELP